MKKLLGLLSKLPDITAASVLLAGFALFGVIVLSSLNSHTKPIIADNEKQALLDQLNALVDSSRYSNDLTQSTKQLDGAAFDSPEPVTVYLAKDVQNQAIAAIFTVTTLKGYSGAIKLVVAVNKDQSLAGVRVLSHKETPGLGDKIDAAKHDWILSFSGKSLANPAIEQWAVKKDGGEFDQFTGATITPRAVVGSVKSVLQWSENNFDSLFSSDTETKTR